MLRNISVVIPTIHPDKIDEIVKKINRWSITPSEIIFCFPFGFKKKINKSFKTKKVKIIFSRKKGQVNQRLHALTHVKNNIILQMDDDVDLKKNCLEAMYKTLINTKGRNVIGAIVFDHNINNYLYKESSNILFLTLQKFYEGAILGGNYINSNMGKISKIGYCFNLNPVLMKNKITKVDWLNSLCLSYKEDIIKHNYFPFKGKALCEDLINSIERNKLGINHLVPKNARFSMPKEEIKNNFKQKLNNFFSEMRIRNFILKKVNVSLIIFYLFLIIEFSRRTIKNVF